MKRLKASIAKPIIIVVILIALFAIFILDFNSQINGVLGISNYELIGETSLIHKDSAVSRFNSQFTLLKSLSRQFTSWGKNHQDPIFESMQLNVSDGNFTSMAIARITGECYTEDRRPLDISGREYFHRALKGEMVVSKTPIASKDSNGKVIVFAVPIYNDNEINGVLLAIHNEKSLNKLLANKEDSRSTVFITDSDGNAISTINCEHLGHPENNVQAVINESKTTDAKACEKIMADIKEGKSGVTEFTHDDFKHYMAYQPLGINDWHIFTMVTPESMIIQGRNINNLMIIIALKMAAVFFLLLAYILYTKRKGLKVISAKNEIIDMARRDLESVIMHSPVGIFKQDAVDTERIEFVSQGLYNMIGYSREDIKDDFTKLLKDTIYPPDRVPTIQRITNQVAEDKPISAKYRIITKSGERRWVNVSGKVVRDDDGKRWIYASMTDITDIKEAEDRLLISEQRYRIISEQSQSIIFDYDIDTGKISYTGNYYEKFGNYPVSDNFPQSALDLGFIYKEDETAFVELFNYHTSATKLRSAEIRIITGKGDYIWVEVTASLIHDSEGNAVKFIGKIIDIDDQKRHLISLSLMAKTDQLTGLLNKTSASALINDELKRTTSMCALLVIDLDGFKKMNDTLGHLVGDKVLSDFAQILKKRYRSTDIISRFGGDEFTVLLKAIPDAEFVKNSCRQIIELMRELKYSSGETTLSITASIGIYYINEGDTQGFLSAYSKADQALYDAKSAGKACFSIYKEEN